MSLTCRSQNKTPMQPRSQANAQTAAKAKVGAKAKAVATPKVGALARNVRRRTQAPVAVLTLRILFLTVV